MPVSIALIKKLDKVDAPLREVLFAMLEEMEKQGAQRDEQVTKREFNELKGIVKELAEAQKKTEQEVAKLAASLEKTQQEVAKLAIGLDRTRREVGGLSRSVAYALENESYRHLPVFLKEKHDIEVTQKIIRTFVDEEEINIFAKARRDGKEVLLVGEAVLKLDDASKLKQVWRKVEAVKEEMGGEVVPIIVTHFAKPGVLERAQRAGILVVQSFEWI